MRKYLFALLTFLFPIVAYCQQPAAGMPPFGSFQTSSFDTINRYNMNVNFAIPIVSSAGRGQPLNFAIVYDSSVWTRAGVSAWTANKGGGWKTNIPQGQLFYLTQSAVCDTTPPTHYTRYYSFSFTDSAGTAHPFGFSFYQNNSCSLNPQTPIGGFATDSSGYHLQANATNSFVVATKSGSVVGAPSLIDSNGNVVSSTTVGSETDWTDSAGHLALKIVVVSSTETDYKYPDTSGTYQTAKLLFASTQVKTNFGCSSVTEYTGTQYLPTELDLANGQKYTFTYEGTPGHSGYYTGRVQRVTLPTGGYYEYDYGATNDGIYCTDGSTNSMNRVVNDGTTSNTWQYSRTPSGSNQVTTVTDPATNASTFTFNSGAQETTEKHYQGSTTGSLLRTQNFTWASNGTAATGITVLEDNSTQNEVETSYDSNGNLLTLKEHDWGTGAPGSVLRTTTNTYLSTTPYVTANILDRVTLTTIADSAGTVHSRTATTYDDSGYINTPCISGAAQHDDSGHGCSYTIRGNPTSVTTYTDAHTPAGGVTKNFTYDSLGNLVGADMDCCQHKQWNYSATTNYAYPDSIVSGPSGTQLTTSATYNSYTGFLATSTDENGKVTTYSYADPGHLNRLTDVQRPDSNHVTYSYNDAGLTNTVTTPVQGTNVVKQVTGYDGLGRAVTATIQDASSNTYSTIQSQYDSMGRLYKTSNPYTGSPSYFTTTSFDALGRVTTVVKPDGATAGTVSYSYATNTTTATDPAGRQKKTQRDGLGRLSVVYEPDVTNSNQLTVQTTYAYTVLNALATVTQGSQTRTYAYDDMGRVTSVKTPETNQVAVSYQYNTFDLVSQRTDPRGVITTYGYDPLNRLQSVSYNVGSTGVPATPSVSFTYGTSSASNNVGRPLTMTDGVGSETYSYDPNLPLMTQVQKVINSTTYTTDYSYNLAGESASITYPSGRVVTQSYDAIGRLSTIASGGTNYASSYGYNTAFQVTGVTYGNGITASFGYSPDRLQLTSLSYVKSSQTIYGVSYWYKQDSTNCSGAPTGNDGIIQCITDSVDSGRNETFAYDALARLKTATTAGSANYPQWGLSWLYDRYGNRTDQSISAGCVAPMTCPTNSVALGPTTNQITTSGYGYDLNGNMTNDGMNTLVYDGENRMTSSSGSLGSGTYTYDGAGLRVKKVSGSTTTVYVFSGSKVIAEYVNGAAPSSPTREYIYSGSSMLAKIEGGATQYYHADQLSVRVMTDSTGTKIGEQGHFPYGESWYAQNTTTKRQFTSYERDAESGNDYATARYDVSRLGRFSAPDPLAGSQTNPQSLNRYAYAQNDPTNLVDPSGLFIEGVNPPAYAEMWSPTDCVPLMFSRTNPYDAEYDSIQMEDQFLSELCQGSQAMPRQRPDGLSKAVKRALEALKNPKCRDLFSHNIDPSALLGQLASGDFLPGSIQMVDLGGPVTVTTTTPAGTVVSTTTTPRAETIQGEGPNGGVSIYLNSNPAAGVFSGSPTGLLAPYGIDIAAAETIIHELGHAANDLYGEGASAILQGDGANLGLSRINTALVLNDCFGGPK